MTSTGESYDAVIVGTGATGGWTAKELSEAGLSVLLLDAGPALEPEDLDLPSFLRFRQMFRKKRQPIQSTHQLYRWTNPALFVDDTIDRYTTAAGRPFRWIRGRQVGGRTVSWHGVTLRMSDHEFKTLASDGYDAEWPFGHDDLAPYYARAERFLHIRGKKEGLPQLPDGEFDAPPEMTPGELRVKKAIEERWPERRMTMVRGIPGREDGSRGFPLRCTQGSTLVAALATGKTTLRPNAQATQILVDENTGKAAGIVFKDTRDGREQTVRAKVVVLAASSIETTRLLLHSKSKVHPNGFANSSDLVGRYLSDKVFVTSAGLLPDVREEPKEYVFGGTHSIIIPRWVNLGPKPDKSYVRGFGMWGGIQRTPFVGPMKLVMKAKGLPTENSAVCIFVAYGPMLPQRDNRATLDPNEKDGRGVPVARIDCAHGDNEKKMFADMRSTIQEMMSAAGIVPIQLSDISPPGSYVHEVGTARMGTDPRASVVTPFGQCWDAKNVFIVDGSTWVAPGWQNPTLTMMAMAIRSSEHLLAELRRGNL